MIEVLAKAKALEEKVVAFPHKVAGEFENALHNLLKAIVDKLHELEGRTPAAEPQQPAEPEKTE